MAQSSEYNPASDAERLALQSELSLENDEAIIDAALSRMVDRELRVLDAGCGTGAATVARFGPLTGAQVVGVDRNAEAVAAAVELSAGLDHLSFEVAEFEDVAGRLGRFDLVFCALVLHVAVDQEAMLTLLWSCVKPGGALIVRGLDDALTLVWPESDDNDTICALTPSVFAGVDRFHGRKLPVQLGGLPEVSEIHVDFPAVTTLCRPGREGRMAYFEVVHGWKSSAVMGEAADDESRELYEELAEAVEAERKRFLVTDDLFASTNMVTVTAWREQAVDAGADGVYPGPLERANRLLAGARHMVLGVTDQDGSWTATLAVVVGDGGRLYFRSPLTSRHAQAIDANPVVSGVIYDDAPGSRVDSIQFAGTARRLRGGDEQEARGLLEHIAQRDGLVSPSDSEVAHWVEHEQRGLFVIVLSDAYVQDFGSWDNERIDRRLAVDVVALGGANGF